MAIAFPRKRNGNMLAALEPRPNIIGGPRLMEHMRGMEQTAIRHSTRLPVQHATPEGSTIWPEMSGNGAMTGICPHITAVHRGQTQWARVPAPPAWSAAGPGLGPATIWVPRFAMTAIQVSGSITWVSGRFATAGINSHPRN